MSLDLKGANNHANTLMNISAIRIRTEAMEFLVRSLLFSGVSTETVKQHIENADLSDLSTEDSIRVKGKGYATIRTIEAEEWKPTR